MIVNELFRMVTKKEILRSAGVIRLTASINTTQKA